MKNIRSILYCFIFLLSTAFVLQDNWFAMETNSFTLKFPKKPGTEIKTVKSALGDLKMEISMYDGSKDNDENYLYGIIISEYPDTAMNLGMTKKLDTFFRLSIDGAIKEVQGK